MREGEKGGGGREKRGKEGERWKGGGCKAFNLKLKVGILLINCFASAAYMRTQSYVMRLHYLTMC